MGLHEVPLCQREIRVHDALCPSLQSLQRLGTGDAQHTRPSPTLHEGDVMERGVVSANPRCMRQPISLAWESYTSSPVGTDMSPSKASSNTSHSQRMASGGTGFCTSTPHAVKHFYTHSRRPDLHRRRTIAPQNRAIRCALRRVWRCFLVPRIRLKVSVGTR